MPFKFTRTFRVRHYECDAYGHVNNANYLRYMQETALDASAAIGYDTARYAELGAVWLAYDTHIEYLLPLSYNDTIEVTTWVADFRRVRSLRMYEFRRGDDLVARASTDWVYIERATGRPVAPPPALIDAYSGGEPMEEAPPRTTMPPAPPPPPIVYQHERRVEWRDIDAEGHVNNAVYLNYMEDVGIQAALNQGWSIARMRAAGFGMINAKMDITYRKPAALDDVLTVSTYLSDLRRSFATRHYFIHDAAGELVARAQALAACVDFATGKPMRMPDDFVDDFAPTLA